MEVILNTGRTSHDKSPPPGLKRFQFNAFNTRCALVLKDTDPATTEAFVCEAADWTRGFQSRFSRFEPESIVSKVNRAAGRESVAETPEFSRLLDLAARAFDATGGRVDISALPLSRLCFGAANSGARPSAHEILQARSLAGFHQIKRSGGRVFLPQAGMGIDLGGLGKEIAVDHVAGMGRNSEISGGLISFGGDLRVFGSSPAGYGWRIGLASAGNPSHRMAHIRLRRGALATSGAIRPATGSTCRHLVDPRTGSQCAGTFTVTIHADECAEAGMWATAASLEADARTACRFLENVRACGVVGDGSGTIFETTQWKRVFPHVVESGSAPAAGARFVSCNLPG